MKVLMINVVCGIRSTGRICTDLATALEAQGHEVKIAYGREKVPEQFQKYAIRIGNETDVKVNALKARLLDNEGLNAVSATKAFLAWADAFNPDMLWLHNIHGYYINYEMLFFWIKARPGMQVKWTLHDCWAFTGHCSHFSFVKCYQWENHCEHCCQSKRYPASFFKDNCKSNFDRKKRAFCGVPDMTLVTPSKWLEGLVKESFLAEYPVEVHYNTVDTTVFKPTHGNFRQMNGLENKKFILGVASTWDERKGLQDFIQLRGMLDNQYMIVLVGLSKKQIAELPKGILGIGRTNNMEELAEIYTEADVFVNPSYEETFGLTTIEAISCGTTAVVYKGTACEEIVKIYGGIAVAQGAENIYQFLVSESKSVFENKA